LGLFIELRRSAVDFVRLRGSVQPGLNQHGTIHRNAQRSEQRTLDGILG
jgi:hypothetical protein